VKVSKRSLCRPHRGGGVVRFTFWRDSGRWWLMDSDGYERALSKTWAESVPQVNLVLRNYGAIGEVS